MLSFVQKQTIKELDKAKSNIDKYKDIFNNLSIEDLILYEKAADSYIEGFSLFNNPIFTVIFSFVLGLVSSDLINFYKLDLTEEIIAIIGGLAIVVLIIFIIVLKIQNEHYIFLKQTIQLCIDEKNMEEIEKRL